MQLTNQTRFLLAVLLLFSSFFWTGVGFSEDAQPGDKLIEALQEEAVPPAPLIPPDVKIHERFKHGDGEAVGTVQKTQGDAYVIHLDQKDAYRLTKNQPLYNGDTIVTMAESGINALMTDKSVIALAGNAKLVIDNATFNEKEGKRQSLVQLLWGRARIIVENLGSNNEDFIIKTPTATCGVRGSDIGLFVGPEAATKTTWLQRVWETLSFAEEAHAVVVEIGTIVLAGTDTTIVVTGELGAGQTLTSLTAVVAGTGVPVTIPVTVSLAAATAALTSIAPALAALEMPSHFE